VIVKRSGTAPISIPHRFDPRFLRLTNLGMPPWGRSARVSAKITVILLRLFPTVGVSYSAIAIYLVLGAEEVPP
jgi:hypothetical protein